MRNYVIVLFLGVLIGSGLVWQLRPPRIETKTVVQEREVIKREIVQKDGTVIKEVIEKDKVKEQQVVRRIDLKYKLVLNYDQNKKAQAQALYRLAGPWFVGASIDSNGVLGVSIGLEF